MNINLKTETCCNAQPTAINGFFVCEVCGKILRPHYDTKYTGYQQSHYHLLTPYSRKSRFNKKMLRALQCLNTYVIKTHIIQYLKTKQIDTPEQCVEALARCPMPNKTRRPYMHVVHYWKALGKTIPAVSAAEINQLLRDFDNILFAWRRLNLPNPQFPYTYLMRQIVAQMSHYSPSMHKLTRFLRVLKCVNRRTRYDMLFQKCLDVVTKKCDTYLINERGDRGEDSDIESEAGSQAGSQASSVFSWSTHSLTNEDALQRIVTL